MSYSSDLTDSQYTTLLLDAVLTRKHGGYQSFLCINPNTRLSHAIELIYKKKAIIISDLNKDGRCISLDKKIPFDFYKNYEHTLVLNINKILALINCRLSIDFRYILL